VIGVDLASGKDETAEAVVKVSTKKTARK